MGIYFLIVAILIVKPVQSLSCYGGELGIIRQVNVEINNFFTHDQISYLY